MQTWLTVVLLLSHLDNSESNKTTINRKKNILVEISVRGLFVVEISVVLTKCMYVLIKSMYKIHCLYEIKSKLVNIIIITVLV